MVKTLYSGHRFNGQEIFHMLCGTAKKKKKKTIQPARCPSVREWINNLSHLDDGIQH